MKPFEKLFFDSAVGLGDAFVMNGIVHHYARLCGTMYYPARAEFFDTLTCLYSEYPNIEVWRFYDQGQEDWFVENNKLQRIRSTPLITTEIHRVDCAPERIHVHWPQQIYENFDVPFKMRYLDFHMPDHIEGSQELYDRLTEGDTEYVLVHRFASDHPEGIPIDVPKFRADRGWPMIKIIEVREGQATNMLQYKKLIEGAKEIHCIPSSFFNLVDSMVTNIKALPIFHDIRKNSLMKVNSQWNKHRWTVVDYNVRL
jgi:hypothetical protein